MSHARKQVRDIVVQVLAAGVPAVSGRVSVSRSVPLPDAELPALAVYTRDETDKLVAMGGPTGRIYERILRLWVVATVRTAAAEPDDQLDEICAEVETALANAASLQGTVLQLELLSTHFEVPADAADKRLGRAGMTWGIVYRTTAGAPTVFA